MKVNSIAVLIACFNRREKTLTCLESLFRQQGTDSEFVMKVFLVDDGSTDGTTEAINSKFPQVSVIAGTGNLYWNRGMHLAWTEALKEQYDYYFWLNDDAVLYSTCVSELVKCAHETKDQAIISGTTRSAISGKPTYGGRTNNKELITPNGHLQLCEYFNGNCVLIPATVCSKIGILDYKFHHAMGDYDYGRRAGKKGIKSYISYGYAGECERHEALPKWCSPSVKLSDRIKAFNSPLAINPSQYFRYDYRYNGLFTAIKHYITIHLRVLFPVFFGKHKKNLGGY